jgi:hypothetical protein
LTGSRLDVQKLTTLLLRSCNIQLQFIRLQVWVSNLELMLEPLNSDVVCTTLIALERTR